MKPKQVSIMYQNIKKTHQFPIVCSLDIHDSSSYMFTVNTQTGEILKDVNIVGSYKKVAKHLQKIGFKDSIMTILEAGPHGFAPYRYFTKIGYSVKIIAPSSIPRRNKKQKTDRQDAIDNLNYHFSGVLRYVSIPGEEDECARECLRARYHVVHQVTKEKQKIIALLKRQGVIYNLTKTNWTRTYYRWLKGVKLNTFVRQVIDMRLCRLESLERERDALWKSIDSYVTNHPEYVELKRYYGLISGIGPVGSVTLILEGRDLNRFGHPVALMNFTGLIPGKHQSGSKDPVMRITKAGNKYMRTVLVGAAKHYCDYRLLHSKKKLNTFPPLLREFLLRCRDRLCTRYKTLRAKGKHSNKVKVAVARELCGFLWEYITQIIPQFQQYQVAKVA